MRKNIISALLRVYSLLGYVDGSILVLPTLIHDKDGQSISNLDYEQWIVRDYFTLRVLLISIDQNVGANLVDLSSIHDVWSTLSKFFDSQTIAQ